MARGGGRGSGSRWRDRCAVVLRRLRLRFPCLRLRLWDRVQLSVLRLWLWDRLRLSGLHRLQLSGLRLWLWQGHCPPWSLCRRSASLVSRTKASRRVSARRAPVSDSRPRIDAQSSPTSKRTCRGVIGRFWRFAFWDEEWLTRLNPLRLQSALPRHSSLHEAHRA